MAINKVFHNRRRRENIDKGKENWRAIKGLHHLQHMQEERSLWEQVFGTKEKEEKKSKRKRKKKKNKKTLIVTWDDTNSLKEGSLKLLKHKAKDHH